MSTVRPLEFDGIDHAVLRVTDIKRSLDFYVGVLGLSLERIIEDIGIYQASMRPQPDRPAAHVPYPFGKVGGNAGRGGVGECPLADEAKVHRPDIPAGDDRGSLLRTERQMQRACHVVAGAGGKDAKDPSGPAGRGGGSPHRSIPAGDHQDRVRRARGDRGVDDLAQFCADRAGHAKDVDGLVVQRS